jgi:hypothetical protein
MMKQFKIMILVNALMGSLFIVFNIIYDYFANMPTNHALWSPLWLRFYNYVIAAQFGDVGVQEPNFSFYFFWTLLLINVYFIIRLQRSKETKPNL